MATIDLGKIKLVWRGTYDGATAYTVDDVVQHTDSGLTSSFICTTASTGNAPSTSGTVHGSWAYLAKGAAGSVLTTQGDILYRDGSGDQRLAKGTASQQLAMNSGATAPEWITVSGGAIKQIKRGTRTSDGTFNSHSAYASFGVSVAITPTAADSSFWINAYAYGSPSNHDTPWKFNISDSQVGATTPIFTDASHSHTHLGGTSHFGVYSFGAINNPDDYFMPQRNVGGMYTPSSNNGNARTFDVICRHSSNGSMKINSSYTTSNSVGSGAVSTIEVWEIANGIYT